MTNISKMLINNKISAIIIGLILLSSALALSTITRIPEASAAPSEACLAAATPIDLTQPALNALEPCPVSGTLAQIEPDTTAHFADFHSAPLSTPLVLLPGTVTLDLLLKNWSENEGPNDVCWDKRVHLPDGSTLTVVAPTCFENPFPAVGQGTCSFGSSPPEPGCVPQGLSSMSAASSIVAPTVIPAGSVISVSVFCPGVSFISVFFNSGVDTDGDGTLEFSRISEPEKPVGEVDKDFRFTDVDFRADPANLGTLLPQDVDGNFLVSAVLSGKNKDVASSTNPGQMYEVSTIKAEVDMKSVKITEKIPVNWSVNPNKPAPGAVVVLFQPSGSTIVFDISPSATIDLTQGTSTGVCAGTQGTVTVDIADIPAAAGEPLGPGDKLLVFVKLQYGLKGQTVNPLDYPCIDEDIQSAELFTDTDFSGSSATVSDTAKLKVDKK